MGVEASWGFGRTDITRELQCRNDVDSTSGVSCHPAETESLGKDSRYLQSLDGKDRSQTRDKLWIAREER